MQSAQPAACGPPAREHPAWSFWLALFILLALFHCPTFLLPHNEGDELVYLGLARKMSWSLQHYSTVDIPLVNEFPARMYRENYFLHPPFYPLLLKLFSVFGDPIVLGLLANAFLHLATAFLVARFVALLGGGALAQMIAALTAAFCPILLAATIKLHIDAWSGFLMLLSGFLLVKGAATDRTTTFLWAGLVYGLALNTKLTALATLPGFLLVSWLQCGRTLTGPRLYCFWLPALLLAAPHAFNLVAMYGTLYPAHLLVHDGPHVNQFLVRIMARTHLHALLYTFALSPFTVLVLTPWFWSYVVDVVRNRKTDLVIVILFFNFALAVSVVHYATERYWALYLPTFYVLVGLLANRYQSRFAPHYPAILLIVWVLMICSSFFQAVNSVNDLVVPSIVLFVPELMNWYY